MGCSLVKSVFYLYCVIKRTVERVPKRFFSVCKNASARVVTESEKDRGRWGTTVDTFLQFQPLLLYFKSKQTQNLSHNKATLYTKYHAKT